jgi:ACS family tartrate transporter-like MFS transporter
VNVGFAALTMNRDLGFSPTVFGFGAGALFAGYMLFQVPGAVSVARVGVPRGVFSLMAVWGLLSAGCAFVQGPASFYVLRFLLGAAEAGFFPAMVFYLTLWFPGEYRARYTAMFVSAVAWSGIVGGPLSGFILTTADGAAGLHGWQWLFLCEGLPAFVFAFAVLKLLPEAPAQAPWLSVAEKHVIATRLARDAPAERDVSAALRDPRVLVLSLTGLAHGAALYGTTVWLPLIVQGMGYSNLATGFLTAVPYAASAMIMVAWGRSSDRSGERMWHLVLAWLLCATGLLVAGIAQNSVVQLLGLTLAVAGTLTSITQLMTLPSWFLRGPAAAGATGLINMTVSLAAALAQPLIGMVKEQTGGYGAGMAMLAFLLVVASVVVLTLGQKLIPRAAAVG